MLYIRKKTFRIIEFYGTLLCLVCRWTFWPNFMENCWFYILYSINLFKHEGFSGKASASFCLLKIDKHAMPSLPGNETTEPLALTVCKVGLCGKAIGLQSPFRCTCFRPVVNNNRQNRRNATCNKIIPRSNCWSRGTRRPSWWTWDLKSKVFDIGSLD